jgi:hypothetical protein
VQANAKHQNKKTQNKMEKLFFSFLFFYELLKVYAQAKSTN